MSEAMEDVMQDPRAIDARAILDDAGCTGVRIEGAGDSWWIWAALASKDGIVHPACAYSGRNHKTPNDPVYLAGSLLDTLRKNVAAHEKGMGLDRKEAPPAEAAPIVEEALPVVPQEEADMAQPININVAPVFNVGGSNASSNADGGTGDGAALPLYPPQAMHDDDTITAAEERARAEAEALFNEPETPADEAPIPESQAADQPAEEVADSVSVGDDTIAPEGAEDLGSVDAGPAGGGGALLADDGSPREGDSDLDYALDADFAEVGEPLVEGADALDTDYVRDPLLLETEPEDFAPDEIQPDDHGPGAFIFGDNIHTIRLAKMGRLSQIARELKATLQEGWTLDEFRTLQNLIVRIDRHEASDDAEARARFLAISERSQAMARVDVHRELREAELEAADREAVEAFDPEEGWP